MPQIPAYPAKTVPSNADLLVMEDTATSSTKKITRGNLLSGAPLPANTVDAQSIATSSVTPEKLLSGTGTSWPYQSYTPTLGNFTLGNGSMVARYKQIGKTVHFDIQIKYGSTSSFSGNITFTLPVTAATRYDVATYPFTYLLGNLVASDVSTSVYYFGSIVLQSTTVATTFSWGASGTYVGSVAGSGGLQSTVPMTWATGDILGISGTYEAA